MLPNKASSARPSSVFMNADTSSLSSATEPIPLKLEQRRSKEFSTLHQFGPVIIHITYFRLDFPCLDLIHLGLQGSQTEPTRLEFYRCGQYRTDARPAQCNHVGTSALALR